MTLPDATLTTSAFNDPMHPQNRAPSDYASSYLQLSDLRTGSKRKRANTSLDLSTPPSPLSDTNAGLKALSGIDRYLLEVTERAERELCVGCVVDCNDANCPVPPEEQCTDHCIVLPCDDKTNCVDACIESACVSEPCDGGLQCMGTLDESLQLLCCTDYHNYLAVTYGNANTGQIDWNCPLDDIWGVNGNQSGFPNYSHFPGHNTQISSIHPSHGVHRDVSPVSSCLSTALTDINATDSSLPTPTEAILTTTATHPPEQKIASEEFACRWLDCSASFSSLNELVEHVNLTHLRPRSAPPTKKLCLDSAAQDIFSLSCRWDDCQIYPDVLSLPGPSTGLQPETALDLLATHFMHDHLGLNVLPPQAAPTFHDVVYASAQSHEGDNILLSKNTISDYPGRTEHTNLLASKASNPSAQDTLTSQAIQQSYVTPESSPPPTSMSPDSFQLHDCSASAHICHWTSCGASFESCAALTEHLAVAHVGSGKGRYDCYWADCARSEAQGFTSKQKIMRHLQAHTGHRPFVCKECGQHFSEAATLAQHMRRHTQERPFVCDFPGCGKAFAITGALTIHKRTHNGERPFRCSHCDRAFAESSNLSKHLRTHTGDRPYRCMEPGCGKAFARPDQLHRHSNVHTKKKVTEAGSSESITVK